MALVCDIILVKGSSGGVHNTAAGFWFTVLAIFLLLSYISYAVWHLKQLTPAAERPKKPDAKKPDAKPVNGAKPDAKKEKV